MSLPVLGLEPRLEARARWRGVLQAELAFKRLK